MRKLFFLCLLSSIICPSLSFAHQPHLVDQTSFNVPDPEVSKAYYGELTGESHIYRITSEKPFKLYVNILEPDIEGQGKNTSALIIKSGLDQDYAMLDGSNFEWTKFWEPFGADSYWKGPEFKKQAEGGNYEIRVLNPTNHGKYVLAIGETEFFDFKEIRRVLKIVPILKRDFFLESPITFFRSPFGWGMILGIYLLVVIVGFLAHFAVKKISHRTLPGMALKYRLLLAGFGFVLLLWAITTTWNPIIIFFSGVCLFEASRIFSMTFKRT